MGSSWNSIKLGEIIEIKYGKDHKKLTEGVIPCYGSGGVMRYVNKSLYEQESILIPRKGSLNNIYYIDEPFWTVDTLFWSKIDAIRADTKFIYYQLKLVDFKGLNEGTAVPSMTVPIINNININLPPIKVQKRISKILSDIDNKIELNKQTNQTLEKIAQTLFKSWFVDFDPVFDNALAKADFNLEALPSGWPAALVQRATSRLQVLQDNPTLKAKLTQHHLVETENNTELAQASQAENTHQHFPSEFELTGEPSIGINGWIPKGWCIDNIDRVTSTVIDHRGKTPKKLGGDWSLSGVPAISAKNIKSGRLVREDTIRYVDKNMFEKWMKIPLQKGDIAMTSEAPLGELYYFADNSDFLLSQRLYGIRADKEKCTGSYLYYWLQSDLARSELDGRATGTTVVGIRQSELRKVLILTPNKKVLSLFSPIAEDYLLKMEKNESNNSQLAKLRDTLLPKLISGELQIPDSLDAVGNDD